MEGTQARRQINQGASSRRTTGQKDHETGGQKRGKKPRGQAPKSDRPKRPSREKPGRGSRKSRASKKPSKEGEIFRCRAVGKTPNGPRSIARTRGLRWFFCSGRGGGRRGAGRQEKAGAEGGIPPHDQERRDGGRSIAARTVGAGKNEKSEEHESPPRSREGLPSGRQDLRRGRRRRNILLHGLFRLGHGVPPLRSRTRGDPSRSPGAWPSARARRPPGLPRREGASCTGCSWRSRRLPP